MSESFYQTADKITPETTENKQAAEQKRILNQLVEDEINEWKKGCLTPEPPPELLGHFLQIQARIKASWFYSEIDDPFYAWHTTAYNFFFDRFKLSSKSVAEIEKSGQEADKVLRNLNREKSILELMEALNPLPLNCFINHERLYGKLRESVDIPGDNNAVVSLSVERMPGSEKNPNLPDYAMQIKIMDSDGALLHDFGRDVKPGTLFLAWHRDQADIQQKYIHVGVFQKQGYYNKGNFQERLSDEAIFALCHEIGHNQQFSDQAFIEKAKKVEGENWMPDYSPLAERDAWVRGIKLLRSIRTREGNRVFTTKINKKIKETITACLSTRDDETFKKGYKKGKTPIK